MIDLVRKKSSTNSCQVKRTPNLEGFHVLMWQPRAGEVGWLHQIDVKIQIFLKWTVGILWLFTIVFTCGYQGFSIQQLTCISRLKEDRTLANDLMTVSGLSSAIKLPRNLSNTSSDIAKNLVIAILMQATASVDMVCLSYDIKRYDVT